MEEEFLERSIAVRPSFARQNVAFKANSDGWKAYLSRKAVGGTRLSGSSSLLGLPKPRRAPSDTH